MPMVLGLRLSRLSGYLIRMANAIKPMFCLKHYCDGERYKTKVFLMIVIANGIKPVFVFLIIAMANVINPHVFIAMANAMQPMFCFSIAMANVIKSMFIIVIIIAIAKAIKPFLVDCDCKLNQHFVCIMAMADSITPLFLLLRLQAL